ncbi:MAG: ATP-binding cassette domain-containing protein [Holosporales bacterium]|jgi:putative ABC transport system ATP-binding protein|nr:ATP-binding cassette domain-containing protein [Holosporales bacterium]
MLQMIDISVRSILTNLNLTINKNEFVLIMGENGSGKTTLFNTISGYIRSESGNIIMDGMDITNFPQHIRASLISNVFQDPKSGTIANMTIRENFNMSYMRGKRRKLNLSNSVERDALYKERLKILNMNLENRLGEYVGNLSGGQRQALSIVMSMISDSKLLLLDEITAALDQRASDNILQLVKKSIKMKKKTCIMITHDAKHLSLVGDRLFILQNGNLKEANSHNV